MTPQTETKEAFSPEAQKGINDLKKLMDRIRRAFRKGGVKAITSKDFYTDRDQETFQEAMVHVFEEIDISYILTESGIPIGSSFTEESLRLIKSAILPYVMHERDLRVAIKEIFHHKHDARIFTALMDAGGRDWLCANANILAPNSAAIQTRLENAAKVVSYRIAAIGIEEEIVTRAGSEESLITPFLEQNREINELIVSLDKNDRDKATEDYGQALVMLKQCRLNIKSLDKAASLNGTSLKQTFLLHKSSKLIDRLEQILKLVNEIEGGNKVTGFCQLICDTIESELRPKKLVDFVGQNVQVIAYRITEHKSLTGEHYITSGRSEFWQMFWSASIGGFIVSIMVIIKMFLHHFGMPPLWEGLAFSLNYAIGFVIVQLLGGTIATKQPAMTAAYLAASLDNSEPGKRIYWRFAYTIASVSRSQLVSFAGNLLVVFPFALLWIFLIGLAGGEHLVAGKAATKIFQDISPVKSLSAMYAAFAGFYLFMAGLISGFSDNKVIVSRIGLRLQHHPFLSRHIRPARLARIVSYVDHNLGGLMGNIAVGFMLGMTGFFGHITGLPLDIRHVTFSMGNFALGVYGSHFHIPLMTLLSCFAGLAVIGLVNFVVSFWLALFVAMRSRGLRFRNYPDLFKSVWKYFRKHPKEFFWPKKKDKVVEEIKEEVEEQASVST